MKSGARMNGLALHHYTLPSGSWRGSKGSATQFDEEQYFATLRNTLHMEELVAKHSAIMDKYDPQKKVGLVVDEWGVWTDVEPGTNGGFLYQQNSLRDAILAALNLHIFQAHADRVTMANIAQMINVLQAMILTDKEKMILTPTYHVFEMLKIHQGATSLPVRVADARLCARRPEDPRGQRIGLARQRRPGESLAGQHRSEINLCRSPASSWDSAARQVAVGC